MSKKGFSCYTNPKTNILDVPKQDFILLEVCAPAELVLVEQQVVNSQRSVCVILLDTLCFLHAHFGPQGSGKTINNLMLLHRCLVMAI